ncbi:MAG: TolB family protein [Planctomycetota bacterium]
MRTAPLLAFAAWPVIAAPAGAQFTQRVSLDSSGVQANAGSPGQPSISADGRYVVFESSATNLVPGDTNGVVDVFVRDRLTATTARVSVDSSGAQGDGESLGPTISADGRYVAFYSAATNLVLSDTNAVTDVFVHDRQTGVTELASVDSAGNQGDGVCYYPTLSADGRYVAFRSAATNLVPSDTNGSYDIFVRDRQSATTERVSVDSASAQSDGDSGLHPVISSDGRFVVFYSGGTNLVPGDTNGFFDVFLRDRVSATTVRASLGSGGAEANANCSLASVSADGRYVAFQSSATNLVAGDTNAAIDVFVRDLLAGTTVRASVSSAGVQGNADSIYPSIASSGRILSFFGPATNLVPGDTNGRRDVFVRDLQASTTERVSVDTFGAQCDADTDYYPFLSADARYVVFPSLASNLAAGDTNGAVDVFLHDRAAAGFSSLCDPGVAGVIACPCGNPPSGLRRGCDNSAATGGAKLSAFGIAYLSTDSLVFTTTGERPTALSIVLQGSASVPAGLVFGQGVRCLGGTLKRLYVKSASGGSITAPDFGAGNLQVSVRSASLGDPIPAGGSRYYLVYYRDPNVLGGCPAESSFNATQTGRVVWWP